MPGFVASFALQGSTTHNDCNTHTLPMFKNANNFEYRTVYSGQGLSQ